MGGTVAILRGEVDDRLLQPKQVKRGLIDRIFGRETLVDPCESELHDGRIMIELPAGDFKNLPKEFEAFLRRTIPTPWQSTKWFFDYLPIALSINLRGYRDRSEAGTRWYLEFSFSGCAGMADTSAELGHHWVEKWIQLEGCAIQDKLLGPKGFHRDPSQTGTSSAVFVPFEGLGYGRRAADSNIIDPDWDGSRFFEFDYSQIEAIQLNDQMEKIRAIDKPFGDLGNDGKCLCQLCSPSFKPPQFDT